MKPLITLEHENVEFSLHAVSLFSSATFPPYTSPGYTPQHTPTKDNILQPINFDTVTGTIPIKTSLQRALIK